MRMSLLTILKSYQGPLTFLLIIFGPSLLPRILSFIRKTPRRQSLTNEPWLNQPKRPIPFSLKIILIFHTLYQISHLLFPPFDVFVNHRLPITSPNHSLRLALTNNPFVTTSSQDVILSSGNTNNPLTELLLTKLSNLDNRYHYSRYGHSTLLECLWCDSSIDYLVYSLPRILIPYVGSLILIGLLGSGFEIFGGLEGKRRGERWGYALSWLVGVGVIFEIGVKYLWDVRAFEGDCFHLASTINHLRPVLLLLISLLHTFLPTPSVTPNANHIIPSLLSTQTTLRLSTLLRSGIQHDPTLRTQWIRNSELETKVIHLVKRDRAVTVAKEGLEEVLRRDAISWVARQWDGLIRLDPQANEGEGLASGG